MWYDKKHMGSYSLWFIAVLSAGLLSYTGRFAPFFLWMPSTLLFFSFYMLGALSIVSHILSIVPALLLGLLYAFAGQSIATDLLHRSSFSIYIVSFMVGWAMFQVTLAVIESIQSKKAPTFRWMPCMLYLLAIAACIVWDVLRVGQYGGIGLYGISKIMKPLPIRLYLNGISVFVLAPVPAIALAIFSKPIASNANSTWVTMIMLALILQITSMLVTLLPTTLLTNLCVLYILATSIKGMVANKKALALST